MATAPVDIPVKVRGLQDLEKLERKFEQLERDVSNLTKKLPKASNNIRGFGSAARQASAGFAALNKAMIKVAAVIATIQGASFIFTSTADLESQTKSLEILTGSAEKARDIVKEIQDFSAVTPFTSSDLIDTSKRLKAFGVDTEKLVETTKRLADVSGATGAKINEVALAYGQVQAKGKLQTEELYQLQERGIGIADELKRMYGLQGEEFTKALEKGQISAKAVEQAFINLTSESGKYFNGATAQSETLAGKWSTLIDAVTRLAQNIGKTLGPALKAILTLATNITEAIVGMINKVNQLLGIGTENAIAKLEREIVSLEGRLGSNNGRRDAQYRRDINAKQAQIALLKKELKATEKIEAINQPYTGPLPALLAGNSKSGKSKATKGLTDAEKELNKQLKIQQRLVNDVNQAYDKRVSAITTLEDEIRYLQNAVKYGEEYADKFREIRRLVMEGVGFNEAFDLVTQRDALQKQVDNANNLNTELTETEQLLKGSYDIIAGELTGAVQGLIKGTSDWGDVLSNILGQLGSMFLSAGFNSLGAGLKLPGFADGGRPPMDKVSVVGERGPELFVPDTPGRVLSNKESFAAATAALSRGGGAASGDSTDGTSSAFAAAAGANQVTNNNRTMMRSERFHSEQVAQMTNPSPIKVSYESTVINNQSYVTEEQFQKGMTQTANRARNQTMRDFRNKPASRKMAGVN